MYVFACFFFWAVWHSKFSNITFIFQEEDDKGGLPRRPSFETLKKGFQLSDCLDYIKTGVEAIIEDQVTSRFEAEELKVLFIITFNCFHSY